MTEPGRYEFGDVRVDLRRMVVSVRGEPVALEPKSFDVLRYLIAHRDRLVGKDDLLNAVWGDAFVTPNVLTRAVAQLRRAIGDDAHNARYIETVATRGYRFVAPVTEGNGDGGAATPPEPESKPAAAETARSRPALRRAIVIALSSVVLALAFAGWWAARRPGDPSDPADRQRPFASPRRVTTRSGVNTWPALSPDGRAVAYVSDRTGDLEISVAGLVPGAREIAITSDGAQNMQPAWSPDGQWLAFHSRKRKGIWVVPATGGTPRQVVEFGSDPAWSPDSERLAFTSDAGGGASQSTVWTTRRDGSDRKAVTHVGEPPGGHRQPAWSHDGRGIAFVVTRGTWAAEIWIAPPDGSAPRRVAEQGRGGAEPQFAPDDRALYWGTPPTGESAGRLWRQALDPAGDPVGPPSDVLPLDGLLEGLSVARDGSLAFGLGTSDINLWAIDLRPDGTAAEPIRLTDDVIRNGRPDYSPDGRIAFSQHGPGRPFSTWLMDDDGTNREPLLADTPAGSPQWGGSERILVLRDTPVPMSFWWVDLATRRLTFSGISGTDIGAARTSPDGHTLAFHVIEPSGGINVWTQSLDGGPRRRVTSEKDAISYPAWSPDGRWLAVQIQRDDQTCVGVVSREGGPVEQLTFEKGQAFIHSWSPDGQRIAFAFERGGVWNLWAVHRRTRVQTQLTRFTSPSGYVRYPAWSPRGNRIVFERNIPQSSVWSARRSEPGPAGAR